MAFEKEKMEKNISLFKNSLEKIFSGQSLYVSYYETYNNVQALNQNKYHQICRDILFEYLTNYLNELNVYLSKITENNDFMCLQITKWIEFMDKINQICCLTIDFSPFDFSVEDISYKLFRDLVLVNHDFKIIWKKHVFQILFEESGSDHLIMEQIKKNVEILDMICKTTSEFDDFFWNDFCSQIQNKIYAKAMSLNNNSIEKFYNEFKFYFEIY